MQQSRLLRKLRPPKIKTRKLRPSLFSLFLPLCSSSKTKTRKRTLLLLGLVTLDEMKAKREDLVREHEKQLAAKLKSEEPEG